MDSDVYRLIDLDRIQFIYSQTYICTDTEIHISVCRFSMDYTYCKFMIAYKLDSNGCNDGCEWIH